MERLKLAEVFLLLHLEKSKDVPKNQLLENVFCGSKCDTIGEFTYKRPPEKVDKEVD